MAKGQSALSRLNLPAKIGIGLALMILSGVVYFVVFYGDLATSINADERHGNGPRSLRSACRCGGS